MIQIYRDPHYIESFTIYGERHSGTKFLEQCIKKTFNLPLTYSLGFKHWFGFTRPEKILMNRQILVFGIIRHPYDWINSFFNMPHHVPKCNRVNIHSFLTSEWYSIDKESNEILYDRNFTTAPKPIRYKNIFELRQQKCLYLSETLPLFAKNYILLSYEFLMSSNSRIMKMINERFHLKICGSPPQIISKPKTIPEPHIKNIIDANIDWSLESVFGFFPR